MGQTAIDGDTVEELPVGEVPFPLKTHLGVNGVTGSGKTHWGLGYARDVLHELGWEVFVIDWKHDPENVNLAEVVNVENGVSGMKIDPDEPKFRVLRFDGNAEWVHTVVRAIHRGRARWNETGGRDGISREVLFVFDEIDSYQDAGTEVHRVFRQGRGNGVHGMAITPRPQDVDKEIFDNLSDGIVFFEFLPTSRARLKARYDIEFTEAAWRHTQKKFGAVYYHRGHFFRLERDEE